MTPVYMSLGAVHALTTAIFTWRFYVYRKNVISNFYRTPSVVVVGPSHSSKMTMLKEMTKGEVYPHSREEEFLVGYPEDKKVQYVAPQHHPHKKEVVQKMKGMNCFSMVHLFDVSPYAEPIATQIQRSKSMRKEFSQLRHLSVAHSESAPDRKKITKLKAAFGRVHEMHAKKNGLPKLRNEISSLMKNN